MQNSSFTIQNSPDAACEWYPQVPTSHILLSNSMMKRRAIPFNTASAIEASETCSPQSPHFIRKNLHFPLQNLHLCIKLTIKIADATETSPIKYSRKPINIVYAQVRR